MAFEDMTYMPFGYDERHPKWPAGPIDSAAVITAVGAWCDTGSNYQTRPGRRYFPVEIDEFVEMSDGTRISIRLDRGITVSWEAEDGNADGLSAPELLSHLEGGLLPDEGEIDDGGELRSWHEYSLRLHALGISVTAEQLRQLPYLTEFSSDLSGLLTSS